MNKNITIAVTLTSIALSAVSIIAITVRKKRNSNAPIKNAAVKLVDKTTPATPAK